IEMKEKFIDELSEVGDDLFFFKQKTAYEMCTEIAKRLGIEEEFTQGRTQEDWRMWLWEESKKKEPTLPEPEEFRKVGMWRRHTDVPF
ncbi:hypothetical protein SC660_09565, partial [Actinotignum timonense]|nr:hypothetical protein [Actinotignum timonense]